MKGSNEFQPPGMGPDEMAEPIGGARVSGNIVGERLAAERLHALKAVRRSARKWLNSEGCPPRRSVERCPIVVDRARADALRYGSEVESLGEGQVDDCFA